VNADGEKIFVEDDSLPAATAATVTEDGGLIYAGTGGVIELSIDALLEGKVLVRRTFRLPARGLSNASPGAVIDNPLVDALLVFGPNKDHLLGYEWKGDITGSPYLMWGNAAWVARMK
jgi:hypothetical protein